MIVNASTTTSCPHCHQLLNLQAVITDGAGNARDAAPHASRPAAQTSGGSRKNPAAGQEEKRQQRVQQERSQAAQDGRVCPVHLTAKPSKFGGLYCPRVAPEGGYCKWKLVEEERAA